MVGPPCDPRAGGPYWLEEGESLAFSVTCATGEAVSRFQFELLGAPAGAAFEPSSGAFAWTPSLDQAAVYQLVLASRVTGESVKVKVGVADAFGLSGNVPVQRPELYTEEYGLPVFFVSYSDTPNKDVPIPARVVYRGHGYVAALKLAGVTTLDFPKKSYNLKFDVELFQEPDRAGGFVNRNKVRLTTTFDDNTYLRHRMAYALWNRLDPALIRVKAYNSVVFLNGHYHGLYVTSDDVDRGLLGLSGLNKDGNLYKARTGDCDFSLRDRYGKPKETPHQGYEKKEGLPPQGEPGAFDDLDAFVTLVATAPDTSFGASLEQLAVTSDFERWWMLVTALHADDNSRKNYYLYRDPLGGRWRYVPWDWNGSFGQSWRTLRQSPQVSEYAYDNVLFARMLTVPAPGIDPRRHFAAVLAGPWQRASVLALFDGFVDEVRGAAHRDERVWASRYQTYSLWSERRDYLDFEGEVRYTRSWIDRQWGLLESKYR